MTAAACDITVRCFSPSLLGATAGLTLGGVGVPMVVSSVPSLALPKSFLLLSENCLRASPPAY